MKIRLLRFNTYLAPLLCTALLGACQTEDKSKKNELSMLHLHLEANPDGTARNAVAQIGRQTSFLVNIDKHFFLTELDLARAEVVDDEWGGFAIKLQFDRHGTWLLEQFTTASKGRRIVVFSEFGQIRWLAAPRITTRISDGVFTFTPDATREETERIVRGLNNALKKERRKNLINDPLPQ